MSQDPTRNHVYFVPWFIHLISYTDLTSSLSSSGKTVKKEPGNEEGQQHFDEADKLLQEFQEAQVDRVGSRPSSNLSSLSNASERDQHHLGICYRREPKRSTLMHFSSIIKLATFLKHVHCFQWNSNNSAITYELYFVLSTGSPSHLGVGDQSEMVHDPYEFMQSPEPEGSANS